MDIIVRSPEIKINKRTPKKSIEYLKEYSLLILDKSKGPKSRESTEFLRERFGFRKAGHAGTLDPITTGVLPVFLNKGNKISSVLSLSRKRYLATMNIHQDISKLKLKKSLKKFTGKIMQRVPKISAVKRQTREREIYSIKLIEFNDRIAKIDVECQAGTYIRKLIHDIGEDLETGAHMFELRRIKSGPFTEKDAISEKRIREYLESDETKIRKILIPLEKAVSEIKKIWVDDGVLKPWSYGSPVYFNGVLQFSEGIVEKEKIAVFNRKNELIGVGIARADSKLLKTAKEGIAVRNFLNLIPNG